MTTARSLREALPGVKTISFAKNLTDLRREILQQFTPVHDHDTLLLRSEPTRVTKNKIKQADK